MKTAAQFLEDLTGNVDAWYADRIDYETFGARQRAAWDEIDAAGPEIKDHVLRAIRQRLPSPTRPR